MPNITGVTKEVDIVCRNVFISGKEYHYVPNAMQNEKVRENYFKLVNQVFGLDFTPWDQSGFRDNGFIPYTLFDGNIAVASVGIAISNFKWKGNLRKYVQISTVATDPAYRKKGLSRWLLTKVINEWKEKVDSIYLYANDSVVNFYPKFGFEPTNEYRYKLIATKKQGDFRKLDIKNKDDIALLIHKYNESNPFSHMVTYENVEIVMFHCTTFLQDNIYYIEQYDAIIIAEHENDDLFCYDIFANTNCSIYDLLGILVSETTKTITLGFTPEFSDDYSIEKACEKNTTLFILREKENLFCDNKITLPFLSRA